MTELIKIASRLPAGVKLRVAEFFKGPEGEQMVRETAMHDIPGSGKHLGYNPGGLHGENYAVPFAEIPGADWEKWFEMNKESDLVKSGAVFKYSGSKAEEAQKLADEMAEAKSKIDADFAEKMRQPVSGEAASHVMPLAAPLPVEDSGAALVGTEPSAEPQPVFKPYEAEHDTREHDMHEDKTPVPTAVHDEKFAEFKDHAGQEGDKPEPKLAGMTQGEHDDLERRTRPDGDK